MAPVEKRRVMASAGSTSSSGTGAPAGHELQQVVQLGGGPAVDQLGEAVVQVGPAVGDGPLEEVGGLHLVGVRAGRTVVVEEDEVRPLGLVLAERHGGCSASTASGWLAWYSPPLRTR